MKTALRIILKNILYLRKLQPAVCINALLYLDLKDGSSNIKAINA